MLTYTSEQQAMRAAWIAGNKPGGHKFTFSTSSNARRMRIALYAFAKKARAQGEDDPLVAAVNACIISGEGCEATEFIVKLRSEVAMYSELSAALGFSSPEELSLEQSEALLAELLNAPDANSDGLTEEQRALINRYRGG